MRARQSLQYRLSLEMTKPSPTFIFRELRRRKVFRTAAIYVFGAWVTLQVCELLFDVLAFPASAMRFVLAAAVVGFPVAVFFGWKYDITSQGIRRTPSITEEEQAADLSLKRIDYLMLSALAIVAILIAIQMPLPDNTQQMFSEPPDNSIAVLPFEVCAGQDLDFMMAAGIANEVINRLAERGKLKVLARASSFSFAGFGLPLAQIAEPLGVHHVLTGTLCRDSKTLTLSVELSDANGFIVWSDAYSQAVSPSGKITQTLASAAASGVAAELGDLMPAKADALVDKRAYEQLLIGREHNAGGDDAQARAAFERALEKQPNYAEAQYEIALLELGPTTSLDEGSGMANALPVVEQALVLVRRQLEYDPQSAQTQFVAGRIVAGLAYIDEELIWRQAADLSEEELAARREEVQARFGEAEQHFRTSIRINPTSTESYARLAGVVESQGRINEALEIYEQAQIRDPFDVQLNALIAKRWAARGRFRQAIELLQRFEKLPKIPSRAWWWQLELMTLQGYWAEKGATLIEMLLHDPGAFNEGNRWQAWWYASQLAWLGLYEEAEAWKIRTENLPMPEWLHDIGLEQYLRATGNNDEIERKNHEQFAALSDEEVLDAFYEMGTGWAIDLAHAGEPGRAIELMQSIQYAPAIWAERQATAPLVLAALLQLVGRDDEALPLLEKVVENLEVDFAAGIRQPQTLAYLAEAYARQQRDDEAIDMLQKAVDYHLVVPCRMIPSLFVVDWRMPHQFDQFRSSPAARLKDDPRMIALCERVDAEFEQQAIRVRKMLAEHDFDELLAPLMAMAEEAVATAQ
jgi:TolB-like protein